MFIRTFSIQPKLQMANISSEYYPFRAENPPEQNCDCKVISNNLLYKLVKKKNLSLGDMTACVFACSQAVAK